MFQNYDAVFTGLFFGIDRQSQSSSIPLYSFSKTLIQLTQLFNDFFPFRFKLKLIHCNFTSKGDVNLNDNVKSGTSCFTDNDFRNDLIVFIYLWHSKRIKRTNSLLHSFECFSLCACHHIVKQILLHQRQMLRLNN